MVRGMVWKLRIANCELRLLALASLAAVALPGCAAAGRWAATHEREYRAEYREGGGAVSMTVRPWNPDLPRDWKGVVK